MSDVHPTAALTGDVQLADDVQVGPHCVLDGTLGPIRIGAGTVLVGSVYLTGPLELGTGNTIYPFACLGFAPQHVKFDRSTPGPGVAVGNDNTFREHVTIHRAFGEDGPTRIGDRNFFMVSAHAGHDAQVGDDNVFVNDSCLGGHVEIADRVTIGGGTVAHQFVRVGRGAMMSGGVGLSLDLPPFFMLTGINVAGSVNLIGMRRSGMSREEIDGVRWAHKVICRQGLTRTGVLETLSTRADEPMISEYIAFMESCKRGVCRGRGKSSRGMANA